VHSAHAPDIGGACRARPVRAFFLALPRHAGHRDIDPIQGLADVFTCCMAPGVVVVIAVGCIAGAFDARTTGPATSSTSRSPSTPRQYL